jgi:hypothetical protein
LATDWSNFENSKAFVPLLLPKDNGKWEDGLGWSWMDD